MVIPAITGGTGNQLSEYPEGTDPNSYLDTQADPLSTENRKNAASLIDAFGEGVV